MGAVASTHSGSHDVGVLVDRPVSSNIMKVGYEHDLIRAFDDVMVYYERPLRRLARGPAADAHSVWLAIGGRHQTRIFL